MSNSSAMISEPCQEKPPHRVIRVVHLLHTMTYGGVETAILNWRKGFSAERLDVHLVCFANPQGTEQPFIDAAAKAGFSVHLIPWSRRKPVFKAARAMRDFVVKHKIDILHCHNTYADVVGLLTARMVPVKTVTTFYVWGDFGWKRNVLQWIDAKIMTRFDQVTAHCESCFRDTVERGISAADVKLLICGYPIRPTILTTEERDTLRSSLGTGPRDIALLYLARFWPEKAHDNLLRALEMSLSRFPNLKLWLAGRGAELERIQELARAMKLQHSVRFLGFRDDVGQLLAAADIQVHPSDNEGVALAVCEGMVAGKPIIASRVGGLPEVLRHDSSAILLEPRNPRALADAIVELATDSEKRRRLGQEAQRFMREEYSIEVATGRVEVLYWQLVGQ
jgi:glycosyltransferase involved in cell wall biosynthesis